MLEKDLEIYDVWESPNGQLFIRITEDYSIAIGAKGYHAPHDHDLKVSQFVKINDVTPVKKVGRIIFD